jgi:hypothetical protein
MSPDAGLDPYWPGPWPAEDGGPSRLQVPGSGATLPIVMAGTPVDVLSRTDPMITMAVTRDPGEVYLLRHTLGDDAESFVERIDPVTLEALNRSADLPGGAMWPGSIAAHGNGSIHVVFGNHAHRLGQDLEVLASRRLPRSRPYNGFVVLPDGTLVAKDFAGSRPTTPVPPEDRQPCELVALDPDTLAILDTCELPEPSIARISASGDHVYVVGDTSLLRVAWLDGRLVPDTGFRAPYRTIEGQTYGWDCVLALGAAWFLDDGDGSVGFDGSFEGKGISTAPLHLIRVDLDSAAVTLTEICGLPGGLIANPPLIDPERSIAVGYDSGNGVMAAFDIADDGTLTPRWQRRQNHASHLVLLPGTGTMVTGDHDRVRFLEQVVAIDITTGAELVRADTEGPFQSTVFPTVGHDGTVYWCSMSTINRVRFG